MHQFDVTGGYSQTFCRYRTPREVWAAFPAWWSQNRPGQPLPQYHNLPGHTGLSPAQLRRLGVTRKSYSPK